jgi:hypothetical protein
MLARFRQLQSMSRGKAQPAMEPPASSSSSSSQPQRLTPPSTPHLHPPRAVPKRAVLCNFQAVELYHRVLMADAFMDAAQEGLCHLPLELVSCLGCGLLSARLLHRRRVLQAGWGAGAERRAGRFESVSQGAA